MDLGITGKKALITGASAGLGLASAVALAKEGVELFINSRDKNRLAVAAEIRYSIPFTPLLIVFSAYALVNIASSRRLGRPKRPLSTS